MIGMAFAEMTHNPDDVLLEADVLQAGRRKPDSLHPGHEPDRREEVVAKT